MTNPGRRWNGWMRVCAIVGTSATAVAVTLGVAVFAARSGVMAAGGETRHEGMKVLAPIVRGNLALFPVVADHTNDSSMLMTLDEGIRSGEVTVTEAGEDRGLVRPGHSVPPRRSGAEVNRLVLANNSKKPLLLLAGEIVTGGKQDRVIGSDRIVPPQSAPIDLGVFCVEPGRWVASSAKFGSMATQMAQPSVRTPAMAEHSQAKVWDNVRASNANIAAGLAAPATAQLQVTSSYAKVFSNKDVAAAVSAEYGGVEAERSMLRELKEKNAVGVVVAINGEVEWADVFASTDLLARYWPKLVRSYIAEAMTNRGGHVRTDIRDAQSFIDTLGGGREVVETEPGIFRRSDVAAEEYRVFTLTALLPRTGFLVHLTKMRQMHAMARE